MPVEIQRRQEAPRRTKSVPSKQYLVPSEEMGEYEGEPSRRRSAPAKTTGVMLYPLDKPGVYGRAPIGPGARRPSDVPFQRTRERKPKVYSSYSVDSDCRMHAAKLADAEGVARKVSAGSRAGSSSRTSPSSTAPQKKNSSTGVGWTSRGSSPGRSSWSPDPQRRGVTPPSRKTSQPGQKTSFGNPGVQARSMSSSTRRFGDLAEGGGGGGPGLLKEEEHRYHTKKAERLGGGRKVAFGGHSLPPPTRPGRGRVSLDGMRVAHVDSWDSMGILGLTNKIWSETKKRQESFVESTGARYLREESSYMM